MSIKRVGQCDIATACNRRSLRLALVLGQVLERAEDPSDGMRFLLRCAERMSTEFKLCEIEHGQRTRPHRFDHRVVEHPAAIEKIGGNEKSGSQPVPLQDRQGHRAVVGISVVEREGERARGQALLAQAAYRIRQRQDVEPSFQERELGVEPRRVRFPGEEGIGLRQYSMEDHHREPSSAAAGRKHVKKPTKAHGGAPIDVHTSKRRQGRSENGTY